MILYIARLLSPVSGYTPDDKVASCSEISQSHGYIPPKPYCIMLCQPSA